MVDVAGWGIDERLQRNIELAVAHHLLEGTGLVDGLADEVVHVGGQALDAETVAARVAELMQGIKQAARQILLTDVTRRLARLDGGAFHFGALAGGVDTARHVLDLLEDTSHIRAGGLDESEPPFPASGNRIKLEARRVGKGCVST